MAGCSVPLLRAQDVIAYSKPLQTLNPKPLSLNPYLQDFDWDSSQDVEMDVSIIPGA